MIQFPCTNCGEPLAVPDELAGDDIQCPVCGSLPSVPTLADLAYLQRDGTLGVAPISVREEPERLQNLARVFGRRRVDDDGNEIDNRGHVGSFDVAPGLPIPHMPIRYDPETGERITPFAVKVTPIAAIPISQPSTSPTVNYATPGKTSVISTQGVWMEMFIPANIFVVLTIWFAHILGILMDGFVAIVLGGIAILGAPLIPSWIFNVLFWLSVSHYANVVYETGTEERDELPRPLRQLEFGEDILLPGFRAIVAFVMAYLPLLLTSRLIPNDAGRVAVAVALLIGGLLFPAMLMCACGSGTVANLRPDRVFRAIGSCGFWYWPLAVMTAIVVPIYLWIATGIMLFHPIIADTEAETVFYGFTRRSYILLPLLTVCVYAFHGICWRLGQLQREKHVQAGWLWQVHEERRLEERHRRRAEREAASRR